MQNEKEIPCKLFNIQNCIPESLTDHIKREALCFRESLMICLKNKSIKDTNPIGCYCILVESIGPEGQEFLVHVQSSMSVDGHFGGSKVISTVTSKFHCLEEKRTEFVHDDGLHEKIIFIGTKDNFYHVQLIRTCPCDNSTKTKDLPFHVNSKLITEGVNILLMRHLALMNYEGTLSFQSITMDADLAVSDYICTPAEHMELDGHFSSVYTIERRTQKEGEIINTVRTYLTPEGKILKHNWLNIPYILKSNPLADPRSSCKTIKIEEPLKNYWIEDIEMFSKYLDMKSFEIAKHTEYLTDHPEIKQLIADYVQMLLVVKPENVIDFTIQHFKAFVKDPLAFETNSSKEDSDARLISQLAERNLNVVCNICGFYIDSSTIEKISSTSFMEESHQMSVSILTSIYSKSSNEFESVSSSSVHEAFPQSKGTKMCTKCYTVDQILQKLQ
ncbi:ciliogenesis-associated TTC17-interacting protein [Xylocopa sonorina]|uniref:ciliogenesis-associated TTC17-interacting protein n=1 Tax=Xylocopa sonorina TaxID=1818115 RepID=UPI00403AD353